MDEQTKYMVQRAKQQDVENRRHSAMQFARDTISMVPGIDRNVDGLIANAAAIEAYLKDGKQPKPKKKGK